MCELSGISWSQGAKDIISCSRVELASIPTYSWCPSARPVAKKAGREISFRADGRALMLFGFSYLYGTRGWFASTRLAGASPKARRLTIICPALTTWQMLAC